LSNNQEELILSQKENIFKIMEIVDDLSKEISDLKKNKREKIGMNDLKP